MKRIQIEIAPHANDAPETRSLLREAGVKRIHTGWYTVAYRGASLDKSTVVSARRNKRGEILSAL